MPPVDGRVIKTIAQNRKARHDFEIISKIEAGIMLQGTEVKSLRDAKCNLQDAYAYFPKKTENELYLINLHIAPYDFGNRENHEPRRQRKLLINAKEAKKLRAAIQEKGLAVIPLSLYFSGKFVKVELAIVRAKKKYDKREDIKKEIPNEKANDSGFDMDNLTELKFYEKLKSQYNLIGSSESMKNAVKRLRQVAPTDLTVLLTGETGVGKEVFAHALHGLSSRKKATFVSVNCGAIPETLLESELFGHEKGAFTGATDQRKGFFEAANNGTIFLDEIGEMPIGTQVKLLRVLESGEFSRLGSNSVQKVDVRIIAATNRELELEVSDGKFRQDLFFRLNAVRIKIPPLRERTDDIAELANFFAERYATRNKIVFKGFTADAISMLKNQKWSGNIRELKNTIETVIALERVAWLDAEVMRRYIAPALPMPTNYSSQNDKAIIKYPVENNDFNQDMLFRSLFEIRAEIAAMKNEVISLNDQISILRRDFAEHNDRFDQTSVVEEADYYAVENLNLEEVERRLIESALKRFGGSRRQAAKALGISERTLYRKLSEYGLDE